MDRLYPRSHGAATLAAAPRRRPVVRAPARPRSRSSMSCVAYDPRITVDHDICVYILLRGTPIGHDMGAAAADPTRCDPTVRRRPLAAPPPCSAASAPHLEIGAAPSWPRADGLHTLGTGSNTAHSRVSSIFW